MTTAAQPAAGKPEAEGLGNARPLGWLVRTGFVARGLTYALIGAIAVRLAVDSNRAPAKPTSREH